MAIIITIMIMNFFKKFIPLYCNFIVIIKIKVFEIISSVLVKFAFNFKNYLIFLITLDSKKDFSMKTIVVIIFTLIFKKTAIL